MYEETPLIIVEDTPSLVGVIEELSQATILGVDTESDSFFSYREKVCLLQLSTLSKDYIIDPLLCDSLAPLAPVFANPNIVKIFHGGDYDILGLQRDFDFSFENVFDTLIAAQLLALPELGLADLIDRFFGNRLDKKYQRHDWSKRPLYQEHIEYARGDTHWILALREILRIRLKGCGRLSHHEEECRIIQSRKWTAPIKDPARFLRTRGATGLGEKELRVLRALYEYRESVAQKLDRPLFKVIPDHILVQIAKAKPTSSNEMEGIIGGKSPLNRRHGSHLLRSVTEGLVDTSLLPKKRASKKKEVNHLQARLVGKAAERTFLALKQWRNNLCDSHVKHTSLNVIPNSTLKQVARLRPYDIKELEDIPNLRNWQVEEFGEDLLAVLSRSEKKAS